MLKITLIIGFVFFVLGTAVADPYTQINDYLVEHEPSDEPASNVNAARTMLSELSVDADPSLKLALEEFVVLPETIIRCDHDTNLLLARNMGRMSMEFRRIEEVLLYYVHERTTRC